MQTPSLRLAFALTLGLNLATSVAMAETKMKDAPADVCAAYRSDLTVLDDCKAFDGSPGGIAGVSVCVNDETSVLLVTGADGQVTAQEETSHQSTDTLFTYVAGAYSLQVPSKICSGGVFDAVLAAPSLSATGSIPLVCTQTK